MISLSARRLVLFGALALPVGCGPRRAIGAIDTVGTGRSKLPPVDMALQIDGRECTFQLAGQAASTKIPKWLPVYQFKAETINEDMTHSIAKHLDLGDIKLQYRRGQGPLETDSLMGTKGDRELIIWPTQRAWKYTWQDGRIGLMHRTTTDSSDTSPKKPLENDSVIDSAISFLTARQMLPKLWYHEGVFRHTITDVTAGPASERVYAYEVFIRRRLDSYRCFGRNVSVAVVLDAGRRVVEVRSTVPEVNRVADEYPTRTVEEALAALNSGCGTVVPIELRHGTITSAEVWYNGGAEYAQPVWIFAITSGERTGRAFAPALQDACYSSLPIITEQELEQVSAPVLAKRVEDLRREIADRERTMWRVEGQTDAEINKVQKRWLSCLRLWQQAVENLTSDTEEAFASFGLERADWHLRLASKSKTERPGRASRPLDAEYVSYAKAILETIKPLPHARAQCITMLSKYADVDKWTWSSEWDAAAQGDPPHAPDRPPAP